MFTPAILGIYIKFSITNFQFPIQSREAGYFRNWELEIRNSFAEQKLYPCLCLCFLFEQIT
ncbi:MAG: hypothetical protein AUJ32_02635 [Parcubacteria group bacterium CG1_02_40_82]|nr:MAG: hypothetical protein AUJ32_02635 [Parcubacteria group bacterium CG1_02_40_82]